MTGLVELPQRVRRGGTIRFFFDEDTLGIGQVMAAARGDCIYPGHPRSPVNVGTDDVDWIPAVAAEGWIVVARDNKIRSRPAERAALAEHPLRMRVLTGAGNLSVWEQLRVLVAGTASLDVCGNEERASRDTVFGITSSSGVQKSMPRMAVMPCS